MHILKPLSVVYGSVMHLRYLFYRSGIFRVNNVGIPVVSVGNLTMGGTGKTPMVEKIVQTLSAAGSKHSACRCTVISRGYKGSYKGHYHVVSDTVSVLSTPEESGDEPYLIALRNTGIPVVVGKKRYIAGKYAKAAFSPDILILDDGFQHMALHRDLDILLLNAEDPFGAAVFPAGTRREFLSAIKRADAVVITKSDSRKLRAKEKLTIERHTNAPIFYCKYVISDISNLLTAETKPIEFFQNKKIGAFAALAEPGSFFSMLQRSGVSLHETLSLRDHAEYNDAVYSKITPMLASCEVLLTTEKDAVKIGEVDILEDIYVVKISHHFSDSSNFENFIIDRVNKLRNLR